MQKKILSFELPEDSTYKLTKVSTTNGYQPNVQVGRSITGDLYSNPIKVGNSCRVSRGFSDAIFTSMIKEIKLDKKNPRLVILETENSIYHLEEVDD